MDGRMTCSTTLFCFLFFLWISTQCLIKIFKSCKLAQIPREQNSQADTLENLGSAMETTSQMSIPLLILQWQATLEESQPEEVSAIEEG